MNYGEGLLKNHKINTQLFQEQNDIINKLRNPGGCDWDRAQTANSLIPYIIEEEYDCLLYTSPSPRDGLLSRMPSSA